jgi:hypothetical protein
MTWNLLIYSLDRDDTNQKDVQQAVGDMQKVLGETHVHAPRVAVQRDGSANIELYLSPDFSVQSSSVPSDYVAKDSLQTFLENQVQVGAYNVLVFFAHGTGIDNLHPTQKVKPPEGFEQLLPLQGFGPLFFKPHQTHQTALVSSKGIRISDPDLRTIIQATKEKKSVSFAFIGFDSCMMGIVEVLYEMNECAPVVAASPIFSYPWNFGQLVARLADGDELTTPQELAHAIAQIQATAFAAAGDKRDAFFAFESAKIKQLVAALGAYGDLVAQKAADPNVLSDLVKQIEKIPPIQGNTYCEISDVLNRITIDGVDAKAKEVRDLLDPLEKATTKREAHLTGAGIFCPAVKYDIDAAYSDLMFNGNGWESVLKAVQSHLEVLLMLKKRQSARPSCWARFFRRAPRS